MSGGGLPNENGSDRKLPPGSETAIGNSAETAETSFRKLARIGNCDRKLGSETGPDRKLGSETGIGNCVETALAPAPSSSFQLQLTAPSSQLQLTAPSSRSQLQLTAPAPSSQLQLTAPSSSSQLQRTAPSSSSQLQLPARAPAPSSSFQLKAPASCHRQANPNRFSLFRVWDASPKKVRAARARV